MTATRSAIPTTHRGQNFRSRLEARWAAFFDLAGWTWVYEPIDADGYIPDFLLTVNGYSFYAEIGPCVSFDDYRRKSDKPGRSVNELGRKIVILGVSPTPPFEVVDSRTPLGLCFYPGMSEPDIEFWGNDESPVAAEGLWIEAGNRVQWKP